MRSGIRVQLVTIATCRVQAVEYKLSLMTWQSRLKIQRELSFCMIPASPLSLAVMKKLVAICMVKVSWSSRCLVEG